MFLWPHRDGVRDTIQHFVFFFPYSENKSKHQGPCFQTTDTQVRVFGVILKQKWKVFSHTELVLL